MEKSYFNTKEAMYYTGIGESLLDSYMSGKIIRNGVRKLYDKTDLDNMMSKRKGGKQYAF